MRLTDHFTLDELTASQTAARLGMDNDPPPAVIDALRRTAHGLEMVRALLQAPIVVSSGYRSPLVNRAVGGAAGSQHQTGEAVDFIAPGFGSPAEVVQAIVKHGDVIPFDQVILEYGRWCHISFITPQAGRRQALVIDNHGTRAFA
jgi:zinc D-Ala-D-Ala carboxypeptidase